MANGGRDSIPVVAPLQVGQRLRALQKLDGTPSPLTPDSLVVVVQPPPKSHDELVQMTFKSRSFACGRLTQAAPGIATQNRAEAAHEVCRLTVRMGTGASRS